MKIYTEINYKWLDGQLVETSSKSFEYKGNLTLCGGGGGAKSSSGSSGSGISLSNDSFSVDSFQDSIQSVTGDDPFGSAMEQTETILDENTDSFGQAETSINETVADTMNTGQSNLEGILEDNNDSLLDLESGINTNVDYMHDYGKAVNDVVSDELGRWGDYGLDVAGHWGRAMGIGGDSGDDVDDPENIRSNDQGLRDRQVANLKANKSKGRARQSLRIG